MANRYGNYATAASLPDDPVKKGEMIRKIVLELVRTIPFQRVNVDLNTLKFYYKEPKLYNGDPFSTFDVAYGNEKTNYFTIIGFTIEEKEDGHQAGNGADHPEGP